MKKKIHFFGLKTFPSQGGTDRVAENIIFQLRDRFDISLYCFEDPQTAGGRFGGVTVKEFKKRANGALGSFIYFIESAFHLFFTKHVDLIHVHKTEAAFFVPLFRLRFKVISTSHEVQYKSDKWGWFAKLYFHFVEWVYIHSSNQCTTISKPLAEFYSKKHSKNVLFIPNGINVADPNTFDINRMLHFIPPGAFIDRPFILFSARRLIGIKGCHTMLDALKLIRYEGQLFITCELHEGDPYLANIRSHAEGLNVFFLGFINPLNALLPLVDRCEFFIFPSESEGMSIMLLEVASVGKPIIASDIPENQQVFSEKEVLYFKSKDVHDLADKIKFALENKDFMADLGKMCQKRVYEDYRWDSISKQYENVYSSLIG
jgi:glycosyltransferase involved in cell wall biosynthesis